MNIIVVGCGRVGSTLAYQLYKKGHQVTVVDQAASAFDNLPADFHGRMEEGDVLSRDVLYRAGIEQADALATVTNSDSVNAVVAHVARTVYHVPNVVVRNYDPRWQPLHEAFGLQVVSSASWGVQRMEELLNLGQVKSQVSSLRPQAACDLRPVTCDLRPVTCDLFVLIAGGEPTGVQLAAFLTAQNHQVRLIEHRREVLSHIHRELATEVIYEGHTTDPHTLEQAGIRQAHVLVACTPSDADNLVLCFLAHTLYAVPRTIGRINNPRHAWLFDQKFHVDVALNEASILARLIEEEMSLGDMMTLLKLQRGQYSLVEVMVTAGARAAGVAIKDMALPEQCVIAAVIRQGEMVVPRGATTLEVGDEVLAMTDSQGAEQLAALFAPEKN